MKRETVVTICPYCSKPCGNPHDIHQSPTAWARFEYENQRGSMQNLKDFAERFSLATALNRDERVPDSIKDALHYLLQTPGEL